MIKGEIKKKEKKRKALAKKIIENQKFDERIKTLYNNYWRKCSIICTLVAVGYFMFFTILHENCKPSKFADWLFGFLFIDITVTCVMLTAVFMKSDFYRSNGPKYNTVKGILLKILCFFDSMVPIMYMLVYFNFDPITGELYMPVWKIIIYAPLAFGLLVLGGAFMNTTAPYSQGTDKMTKNDWRMMRQEQELAGLDPDKMPITLSPDKIKGMTKADWHMLGMDLELAGYDVFKK